MKKQHISLEELVFAILPASAHPEVEIALFGASKLPDPAAELGQIGRSAGTIWPEMLR